MPPSTRSRARNGGEACPPPPWAQDVSRDASFMRLALALGRRNLGRTWPNPSVGAVVVAPGSDTILSAAATAPGGRPHAETQALALAGEAAKGATLYVTLEPCSHHGRTPPCTEAIVAAGIGRVVSALEDPDPRVAGEVMTCCAGMASRSRPACAVGRPPATIAATSRA